jgi:hypothetical protein
MTKCIYCNAEEDLSESDIIPDALTNAKLTSRNVCRIKHNSAFSDAFESKIIHALSFITDNLDIKSSKSKSYIPHKVTLDIDGYSYNRDITSIQSAFQHGVFKSTDKKMLFGTYNELTKIAANSNDDKNDITPIDLNKQPVGIKQRIPLEPYFSIEMYRLVTKIAYEWFCKLNEIYEYRPKFLKIVDFITEAKGDSPAEIIEIKEIYELFSSLTAHGSHTLLTYVSGNSVVIIVSLFGVAIYKVTLPNDLTLGREKCCYQELMNDSQNRIVEFENIENLQKAISEALIPIGGGCLIPKNLHDTTTLEGRIIAEMLISNSHDILEGHIVLEKGNIAELLCANFNKILQFAMIHKRGLKRFVKENLSNSSTPLHLNLASSEPKFLFNLYAVFLIGLQDESFVLSDSSLYKLLQDDFGYASDEMKINKQKEEEIRQRILMHKNYSDTIYCGAKRITEW